MKAYSAAFAVLLLLSIAFVAAASAPNVRDVDDVESEMENAANMLRKRQEKQLALERKINMFLSHKPREWSPRKKFKKERRYLESCGDCVSNCAKTGLFDSPSECIKSCDGVCGGGGGGGGGKSGKSGGNPYSGSRRIVF